MRSDYYGLNRNQAVQISRLSGGESFVDKRKKFFLFNAFIDFEPMLMA